MKKLLTLLFGALIALSLFVTTGNTAKAAEQTSNLEECSCHEVTPILGEEKNKLVAELLSSQEFKNAKLLLLSKDYTFSGVSNNQVFKHNIYGITIVGVPFSKDGIPMMAVFFDSIYQGISPL